MKFAKFYWQFISGFNWIATSLILILQTINRPATKKLPSIDEKCIKAVASGNMVDKVNIFGKAKTRVLLSKTEFFILEAR